MSDLTISLMDGFNAASNVLSLVCMKFDCG
jgi:hypothetical protein